MKNDKKRKVKVVRKQQQQISFAAIQEEIKKVLETDPDMNEYVMFLAVMKVMLEYTSKDDWGEMSLSFIQNHYFDFEKVKDIKHRLEFRQPYKLYCELMRVYYLLADSKGKMIFHKMLNWFPVDNKKKIIQTWPNTFILSCFRPIITQENIYFEDIRTKKRYNIADRDNIILSIVKETHLPFLSLIVPSGEKFLTDMFLLCENFDLINPNSIAHLTKSRWEEYLLDWYRNNLLKNCLST